MFHRFPNKISLSKNFRTNALFITFIVVYFLACFNYYYNDLNQTEVAHSPAHRLFTQIDFAFSENQDKPSWHSAENLSWSRQSLPHNWHTIDPNYKGWAWYRIKFNLEAQALNTGNLYIPYINHHAQILLNERLIYQTSLPWQQQIVSNNTPYLFSLPKQFLHTGENEIRIAVYSESPIRPGLGKIQLSSDESLNAIFQRAWIVQQLLPFFSFICFLLIFISLTILWLLYRNSSYLLWLSLVALALSLISSQQTPYVTSLLFNYIDAASIQALYEIGIISIGICALCFNYNFFNKSNVKVEKSIILLLTIFALFLFIFHPPISYKRLFLEGLIQCILLSISSFTAIRWVLKQESSTIEKLIVLPQIVIPITAFQALGVNFGFIPSHFLLINSIISPVLIWGVLKNEVQHLNDVKVPHEIHKQV